MNSVPDISLPDPFQFEVPFKKPLGHKKTSAMLPHEVFSAIYHFYPDAWSTSVLPTEQVLSSFWDGNRGHPQMSNHPVKDRSDFRTKCIPIGMHGDEVPVTGIGKCWSKMLLTFSWFSMVAGAASTKDAMFWVWATFEQFSVEGEHGTLDTFMKVLEWSLYWMWRGLWPTHSWTGEKQLVIHNANLFRSLHVVAYYIGVVSVANILSCFSHCSNNKGTLQTQQRAPRQTLHLLAATFVFFGH